LCSNDYDRLLKFEIVHKEDDGDIISEYYGETTLNKLSSNKSLKLGKNCIMEVKHLSINSVSN